jgi:heme exporter protein D
MSGWLGPYTGFIVASYGLAALVVCGLMAWIGLDHARLRRRLADLEARGARRRSAEPPERQP